MSDGLLLLTALCENSSVEDFRQIQQDYFVDSEVELYSFIQRHYRSHGVLPSLATLEERNGRRLPETPEPVSFYLQAVYDRRVYNLIRPQFNDLRACLSSKDIEGARRVIQSMGTECRINLVGNDLFTIDEVFQTVLSEYRSRLFERLSGRLSGVTSGYDSIDRRTGGYDLSDLVVWVGRPRQGKTYLLLKQALSAWRAGRSVLLTTMEMSAEQCGKRLFAIMAGVNPSYIKLGRLSNHAIQRMENARTMIENSNRFHILAGAFNGKVAGVDMLIQQISPDAVYIDGIYLLRSSEVRRMGRWEESAYVMDELRKMTIVRNKPVICTSQENRTAGDKGEHGDLSKIGYTDAIATHATSVYGILPGKAEYGREKDSRVITCFKERDSEGDYSFAVDYKFAPISFEETEYTDLVEQPEQQTDDAGRRRRNRQRMNPVEPEDSIIED